MLVINRFGIAETAVIKGDSPGHPFRGNQWTNGGGTIGGYEMTAEQATEFEATLSDSYAAAGVDTNTLPADEAQTLWNYRGFGHININDTLRNPENFKDSDYDRQIAEAAKVDHANLDSIMEKAPALEQDIVVYRGMKTGAAEALGMADVTLYGDNAKAPEVGRVIHDKGYASTTLVHGESMSMFGTSGMVLEVKVPKGTKALSMNAADKENLSMNFEHEMLLPRDSAMVITGSYKADGYTIVQVELIP